MVDARYIGALCTRMYCNYKACVLFLVRLVAGGIELAMLNWPFLSRRIADATVAVADAPERASLRLHHPRRGRHCRPQSPDTWPSRRQVDPIRTAPQATRLHQGRAWEAGTARAGVVVGAAWRRRASKDGVGANATASATNLAKTRSTAGTNMRGGGCGASTPQCLFCVEAALSGLGGASTSAAAAAGFVTASAGAAAGARADGHVAPSAHAM
eukprot:352279-Chlamydomonas_euryale.AAC.5